MKVTLKVHPYPQHGQVSQPHAPHSQGPHPQTVPTTGQEASPSPSSSHAPGRSLVVVDPPKPPRALPGSGRDFIESPLKKVLLDISARAISPREMQALSEDLYAGGVLTWEEYAELAFQADLHPDFPHTIGALTGERPRPDQPRDFVKQWEERLDFERRHFPEGPERDRALHILSVLRRIDVPTSLKA